MGKKFGFQLALMTLLIVATTSHAHNSSTVCGPTIAGFKVIPQEELEALCKGRVCKNPFHESYGVFKMSWNGRIVAVKIDTVPLSQLLPVVQLEAQLRPVGGVEILGVMDKSGVEALLKRTGLTRDFEAEKIPEEWKRNAESAVIMEWAENIRNHKTEIAEIAESFSPQPAMKVISKVAKLFLLLESLKVVPRDFQVFLKPTGDIVILDLMTSAVYFDKNNQLMSRGQPVEITLFDLMDGKANLWSQYRYENLGAKLDGLFKEFIESLEAINMLASLPHINRGRIFYMSSPTETEMIPDNLNFREVARRAFP